jgi:hypothetical protein
MLDRAPGPDTDLVEAAIDRLTSLGIDAHLDRPAGIELRWPGGSVRYSLATQRGLRPSLLGAVVHRVQDRGRDLLLVADYVSPPLAERLRERGIEFIDTAGNAFLNRPPLLVWVKGERPAHLTTTSPTPSRIYQAGGLHVLFALLAVPGLARETYRVIADQAGVSHGTVGVVMGELTKLGFLAEIGGRRRLLNTRRLVQQWSEAFARTLRPKLLVKTMKAPSISWWRELNPDRLGLVLGGEAAASRQTGVLDPGTLTLYGTETGLRRFVLEHPLPTDPRGNVELLKRFWQFEHDPADLTPPLLTYADLLVSGDARCSEAAQAMEGRVFDRSEG